LHILTQQQNTSADAVALAAVLAQDWADVVLSGSAHPDHLLSNLKALELDWDEELDEELAGLAESPEVYWQTRKGLRWN
jgi:aryl-alcohol dehydrogenase-like predicted oxidoreductase